MAYGFSAINDSGQIIISNETDNMHYIGKATYSSNDGGDYSDFPGYSGSYDTLDGRVIFNYTITSTATPLVFIKPNDYNRWHALIRQYNSGNTWYFEVMLNGTSTSNYPDLYCFVNAEDAGTSSENYGLIVYKDNGDRTFDSRLSPLAVTGGGNCIPPSDPTDTSGLPTTTSGHPWNYATLDHDFRSTTRYNSYSITGTHTDLMFAAPSLAQATYKRQMEGYKRSCGDYGCCCQDHYSTAAWWVMYRNAFRIRNGYFDAGWGTYAAGYAFSSQSESGGWFGGGGGSYSSGTMPYTAKTINYFSNVFILADATGFDT